MLKAILAIVAAALMSSCVLQQGPTYPEATDPAKAAKVQDSKRHDGFLDNTYFGVSKVNHLALKFKTRATKGGPSHLVEPGPQKLTLVMFHGSPLYKYGQMTAEGEVKATLKPGVTYEAYGHIQSRLKVDLWLQEANSKKRVSVPVSVVPVLIRPAPTVIFIPS